jgi:hypothetical protein
VLPHVPLEHTSPGAQTFPHPPQLALSVVVVTQDTPASPTQTVCAEGHWATQLPPAHICPAAHALPQPPQFWGSTLMSEQVAVHWVVPGEHVSEQTPAEHSSAPAHLVPHPPQLAGSVIGSTQLPSHVSSPSAHEEPELDESLEHAPTATTIAVTTASTCPSFGTWRVYTIGRIRARASWNVSQSH